MDIDKIYPKNDTELIDKLYLELSQFSKARTKNDIMLQELIYAVENKFPGESRFDTALRYIQEAESGKNEIVSSDKEE